MLGPQAALRSGAPLAELEARDHRWVDDTVARLTVRQKAAQLVMVRAYGRFAHPRSTEHQALLAEVRDLEVGGVVLFQSDVDSIPPLLDELQAAAPLPLLVSADLERGLAFRVADGVVPLPWAMAIGATRSPEAARFSGEVTAREARALGIHWALSPVADVNNNPGNPIVNIRSYGEDPALVAEMVRAYVAGARSGGVLTTAKHFPGHGDTAVDSHLALPTIPGDRARLEAIELAPFRAAVADGVDTVMTGHLAVPAIDPSGAPATLSPLLTDRLLRHELGFSGLIVTDAMEMRGVAGIWAGKAAVDALRAGADVLLLPPDPRVAIDAVTRAVEEGSLSEERLDRSLRRLLEAKARLGLHRGRFTAPRERWRQDVGRPEDVGRAEQIAAASITLVKNEGEILPLPVEQPLRLLHLSLSSDLGAVGGIPEAELRARSIPFDSRRLGPEISAETARELVAAAPGYSHVVVSAYVRVTSSKGTADMVASHAALLRELAATGVPLVVVSYGSPYLLGQFPEVPVYLCTYGPASSSQRAAVAALFGEQAITGRLPVSLPGLYPFGHGIQLARRELGLPRADPEAAGFRPEALAELDRVVEGFVAQGAFPGAVVAAGHRGRLGVLRAYGHQTYQEGSPAVTEDTIYDLASLTKVITTTTMAMILVDEGRLDLEAPVQDYLPGFVGRGKDSVIVRQLLSHSSGAEWWGPLYQDTRGKAAYLEKIQAMPLAYDPGTKSVYSDLGIFLLGEILERAAGEPLDRFVERRVFAPLGMRDTMFRPDVTLRPRIAPTEEDPWRDRLAHGEVHDENAYALGGVAPHAGLFGTAGDLARFAQMMLQGGVFDHQRIVSSPTVERFTRLAGVPDSSRALGWDTRSPEGSSSGDYFSMSSYGHTGFTGTSLWIDPERQLFVILLTNRVHPSRDNQLIRQARPAVANAVVEALAEP